MKFTLAPKHPSGESRRVVECVVVRVAHKGFSYLELLHEGDERRLLLSQCRGAVICRLNPLRLLEI
jgi:hypothetical protein